MDDPFELEGNFFDLPQESDEFAELEERTGDPLARAYVDKYSKLRQKRREGFLRFFAL